MSDEQDDLEFEFEFEDNGPYVKSQTRDEYYAALNAAAKGLPILEGTDNTLLIDLDTPITRVLFEERLHALKERLAVTRVQYARSRGGHFHAVVTLRIPVHAEDRIFWQLALGSDPVHERACLVNFRNIGVEPALFLAGELKEGTI